MICYNLHSEALCKRARTEKMKASPRKVPQIHNISRLCESKQYIYPYLEILDWLNTSILKSWQYCGDNYLLKTSTPPELWYIIRTVDVNSTIINQSATSTLQINQYINPVNKSPPASKCFSQNSVSAVCSWWTSITHIFCLLTDSGSCNIVLMWIICHEAIREKVW